MPITGCLGRGSDLLGSGLMGDRTVSESVNRYYPVTHSSLSSDSVSRNFDLGPRRLGVSTVPTRPETEWGCGTRGTPVTEVEDWWKDRWSRVDTGRSSKYRVLRVIDASFRFRKSVPPRGPCGDESLRPDFSVTLGTETDGGPVVQ